MSVVVIEPPADLLVSVAEAKDHLSVDFDDDDSLIEALIETAIGHLDGPSGWLGRALGAQTLEWRGDSFGHCDIRLYYPPIVSIVSVKYDDDNGVEQTVNPSLYRLIGQPGSPRLSLAYNQSWPSTRNQSEAVRVQYTAGWPFETDGDGDDAVQVWTGPAPIKHAVLLMVGHLYENREAVTVGSTAIETPMAVRSLLSTYWVPSL